MSFVWYLPTVRDEYFNTTRFLLYCLRVSLLIVRSVSPWVSSLCDMKRLFFLSSVNVFVTQWVHCSLFKITGFPRECTSLQANTHNRLGGDFFWLRSMPLFKACVTKDGEVLTWVFESWDMVTREANIPPRVLRHSLVRRSTLSHVECVILLLLFAQNVDKKSTLLAMDWVDNYNM